MGNKELNVGKLLFMDYGCFLFLMFPVMSWVLTGIGYFRSIYGSKLIENPDINAESLPFFLYLAIGLTVVFVPLLLRRIGIFRRVWEQGRTASGWITGVSFYRGRGTLRYNYEFQGKNVESANTVMRNKQTRDLQSGMPVEVMVDPEKPKRGFLVYLYSK